MLLYTLLMNYDPQFLFIIINVDILIIRHFLSMSVSIKEDMEYNCITITL